MKRVYMATLTLMILMSCTEATKGQMPAAASTIVMPACHSHN